MKRHPAFVPLSREHHRFLVLAQVLKSEVTDYQGMPQTPLKKSRYAMKEFVELIEPHIAFEEAVLFPLILGHSVDIDQLIYQLQDDHVELRALFDKLESEVNLVSLLDEIGHALDAHVRLEERMLFEQCQVELSEEVLKQLSKRVEDWKA